MAKMFYTMDEARSALGKNEEEIKQLAREGRLREFRDGPRLMFKADQVEQLKGELGAGGGGEPISLVPESDSGAPIGLADSRSASASGISLVDSSAGRAVSKEDTHLADLGLSGSLGGVPSPGRSGDSRMGTRGGMALDVEDSRRADPSAQTAINAAPDQVSLEGSGLGSGLLDLTRESDDTSLGAVFDELTPSGGGQRRGGAATPSAAMETQAGEDLGTAVAGDRGARAALAEPMYVQGPDAMGTALGFAAAAATIVLCFGGFILAAAVMGFRPSILDDLRRETSGMMYVAIAVGITVIFTVAGFFVGKTAK